MSCDQAAQGTDQALESCFSGVWQPPVAAPWAAAPYMQGKVCRGRDPTRPCFHH